jgi:hypothetical protein
LAGWPRMVGFEEKEKLLSEHGEPYSIIASLW